jgi:hypothetical protein
VPGLNDNALATTSKQSRSILPDSDDGVGDQDEQDDEGLHEGRDRLVAVLKEGQNLK